MSASRVCEIEGRPIRVYDGLLPLPDVYRLTAAMEKGAFTRDEVARPETANFRHWALNIPLETAQRLPLYQPTLDAAREFKAGDTYRVYRSYCNHASFGDMLFTHTDCAPGSDQLTALWFIAPEWNAEWGGETLFFNSQMDAEVVVSPKPGRLVIFDGSITHAGRPPNRICYAPRYTLAFKLKPAA
ncbi:MAG: 2OG-Fe(II) oxygenase [Gammaproteobacteria bacterium]